MVAKKIYAVVGASNDKSKYGNKVYNYLKSKGHVVYPVNNKETNIEGKKAYKSLLQINDNIDTVVFVVPPQATQAVLKEVSEKKIKQVWMQPGSESEDAIHFCKDNNIDCIHHACIML